MNGNIQSLGYLLKKEKLASLTLNQTSNVLLLESPDPYPGILEAYNVPENEISAQHTPRSVFMVLKNFDVCHEDDFIRIVMFIKRDHQILFDAALSSIVLFNEPVAAIRINMDDINQLHELVDYFKRVGIKFQTPKQVKPYLSLIKIRRFFDLQEISDGIYKDLDTQDAYYLRMPVFMNWNEFEGAAISIRNNCDYKTYDAAQAAIYNKQGIIELVRIYDRKANLSKLQLLQQKFIVEAGRN